MSSSWQHGGALPPEFDPRGGRHVVGSSRSRGPLRVGARVVAAALSMTLIVYIGYLWSQVHGLDDNVHHVPINALDNPVAAHPSASGDSGSSFYDIDGKDQNILIVGNDDRAGMTKAEIRLLKTGSNEGSLSTDTMMIVHVPADGSRATLISLPRDSYVAIPGHGMWKLNAAYAYGYRASSGSLEDKIGSGADLLIRTIENLTDLRIDHFVQVGLVGFYRIAKAIGTIPVNLCHAVDDTHAYNVAHNSDGGSGFKMTAGHHDLTPVQALEFVRQRHGFNLGDLQRVQRQRYFLTAAFRQIASAGTLLDPGKLGNLVDAVDSSLYVDQGMKLLDLAKQMSNLSADNIVGKTIPYVRDDPYTDAGDALIIDPAQVKRFVKNLVQNASNGTAYSSASTVDPSTVSVTVLNAGTTDGAAATAAGVLSKVGFRATASQTQPDQQATTTITYPSGSEAQAKTLAKYVPGAQVRQADVSAVTLTLGTDGVTAASSPAAATHPKSGTTSKSTTKKTTKKTKAIDSGCID